MLLLLKIFVYFQILFAKLILFKELNEALSLLVSLKLQSDIFSTNPHHLDFFEQNQRTDQHSLSAHKSVNDDNHIIGSKRGREEGGEEIGDRRWFVVPIILEKCFEIREERGDSPSHSVPHPMIFILIFDRNISIDL
jgi:hypothetical protein